MGIEDEVTDTAARNHYQLTQMERANNPILAQILRSMHGEETTQELIRAVMKEARNKEQAEEQRQQAGLVERLRREERNREVRETTINRLTKENNDLKMRLEEKEDGNISSNSVVMISDKSSKDVVLEKVEEESSGEIVTIDTVTDYESSKEAEEETGASKEKKEEEEAEVVEGKEAT